MHFEFQSESRQQGRSAYITIFDKQYNDLPINVCALWKAMICMKEEENV